MDPTHAPDLPAVVPPTPIPPVPSEVLEQVLIGGDLSELDASQRAEYYEAVCKSIGLNPLTKPFEYLTLNGKLRLYALRDCADQLRRLHGISIYIANREKISDIYVVTARAKDKTGREDESTGAVPMGHLKGDALANALMKAETKAKRRVTLSIAGLGWLDETELDTVKGVVTGAPEAPVATIHDAVLDETSADGPATGGTAPNGGAIPEGIQAMIKAILSRIVGLYPGAKSDPTVIEDRKNMLHTIFGCEIESGMAGVQTLAALGRDALRDGLATLDRLQRETPPPGETPQDDGAAVHPDIAATAELIASLQARATRVGVSAEAWQDWLEEHQIPRTVADELILSPTERGRLTGLFNEALAELKAATPATPATPAAKPSRRRPATGA
jgi:hypothetical protein